MKAMNKNFKLLKQINFDNDNELKSEQVIYSYEEWEFKTIGSQLTHKNVMDDTNFPHWDNWSNLITHVISFKS